jgi:hypothetical protein
MGEKPDVRDSKIPARENAKKRSPLQNVAAGFNLRFKRMEDLGLPAIFYELEKTPFFKMNFARGSKEISIKLRKSFSE